MEDDELGEVFDDALPTCPTCLQRYEIAGVTDHPELEAKGVWLDERLFGLCACGLTQLHP